MFTRKKSNCRIFHLTPIHGKASRNWHEMITFACSTFLDLAHHPPPPVWDNVQDVVSTIIIIHATKFKRICTFFHSPCSIQTLLLPLIFIRKYFALFSFHLRYIFALKRRQSEVLSKTKRRSIEDKAKIYRRPIEDLSKIYRRSIEERCDISLLSI